MHDCQHVMQQIQFRTQYDIGRPGLHIKMMMAIQSVSHKKNIQKIFGSQNKNKLKTLLLFTELILRPSNTIVLFCIHANNVLPTIYHNIATGLKTVQLKQNA